MTTFARRPVLTTNIATLLIGSAMISTFVLVPQLAQLPEGGEIGFGLSATQAGLLLVPGQRPLAAARPVRRPRRRAAAAPSRRSSSAASSSPSRCSAWPLAHGSVALVILWACLVSAGVGAVFAAIPNLIVNAVDAHETGEATGVNTIMRNVGSAIGAQLAGTMIATHVLASGLPEDSGFMLAFLIGAIGAFVAALCVLLIPGRGARRRGPRRAGDRVADDPLHERRGFPDASDGAHR